MTTYKGIRGQTIRTVDGDPSTLIVGDIWYNSSSRKIKGAKLDAGTWATGNNLTTGRGYAVAAGTQTAGLCIGGWVNPSIDNVESYDGTNWTEITDLNTGRDNGGSGGTQTAAIVFAGRKAPDSDTDETETWNGSAWTEVGDVNTARKTQGNGTTTSAICYGGGPPQVNNVETWNGTSWTETTDINTTRYYATGVGASSSDAMMIGGQTATPAYVENVEKWNGTAWTEVAVLNTGRSTLGGAGTTTLAVAYGGGSPTKDETETWDGTSWTETNNMSTARYGVTKNDTGSQTAALCSGGTPPGWLQTTEEFTIAAAAVTFTSS